MAPLLAALLTTSIMIAATAGLDWAAMVRVSWVFMPASIAAALVCWLLTRRLFTPLSGGDRTASP